MQCGIQLCQPGLQIFNKICQVSQAGLFLGGKRIFKKLQEGSVLQGEECFPYEI